MHHPRPTWPVTLLFVVLVAAAAHAGDLDDDAYEPPGPTPFDPDGFEDGRLVPLEPRTLQNLPDAGCHYHSPDAGLVLCIESYEAVEAPYPTLVFVHLDSGLTARAALLEPRDGNADPRHKTVEAVNDLLESVSDWQPIGPALAHDFNLDGDEPPLVGTPAPKPVDVDGMTVEIGARWIEVRRGDDVLARHAPDYDPAHPTYGDLDIEVYTFGDASHAVVTVKEATPGFLVRTVHVTALALEPTPDPRDPADVACPDDAPCSATHAQLAPYLERVCEDRFDEGDVLSVAAALRERRLDRDAMTQLLNTWGALTGYDFRSDALDAFFYGEHGPGEGAAPWLPTSCRDAIAAPRAEKELPSALRKRRADIKRLYLLSSLD